MIRVVLIDDEESALDILEILLREHDHITIIGRYMNPLSALEAAESWQADAVFLDIQMPGLLGTDVAKRIKAKMPHMQIIFTTAYSEFAVEAFETRSLDYLLKPFTRERLQDTVSRIVKVAPDGQSLEELDGERTYVQYFGGFHVRTERGHLPWKTHKEKELCAFLMFHEGNQIEADTIIESIWPDSDLKKARSYLYTCISYLRKSLQANGVHASVDKIGRGYVMVVKGMESDLEEFLAIVETATSQEGLSEQQYETMNGLYKGGYLETAISIGRVGSGDQLKVKYMHALRVAHKHFISNGNIPLAVDSLQRILVITPDSENDGRELIKLYINSDNRNEALRVFRQLDDAVRVNLGVELEEATIRLYNDVVLNR